MTLKASYFKHMIELMPINVLVCNSRNFKITYANQKSKDTLNSIEALLPKGISGKNIVGQCIDIFHKKPEHQRSLLSNPNNLPHNATIRLGKEFLDLQIVALPGCFGKSHCMMLTWTVVTEIERLKRMVDKMPINIMMCDPETFEITFMNETSLNTLRTIENLLPVKADKVVGSTLIYSISILNISENCFLILKTCRTELK